LLGRDACLQIEDRFLIPSPPMAAINCWIVANLPLIVVSAWLVVACSMATDCRAATT
jgi:hypothetical protein